MTPQQALAILIQVSSKFVGTKQDHEVVDQALQTLGDLVSTATEGEDSNG